MKILDLNGSWRMKRTDEAEWLSASVPGSVYSDLLTLNKIEDPFYRDNEETVMKLSEYDFEYERTFEVTENFFEYEKLFLLCEGLDTLANIFVNNISIAKTDNMFRSYEFDIKSCVRKGTNTIKIVFSSPLKYAIEKYKKVPTFSANGVPGFQHIRKAHYMFGWDWGPNLPDMGIWKNISIVAFNFSRIDEVYVTQHHEDSKVSLDIKVLKKEYLKAPIDIKITLISPKGEKAEKIVKNSKLEEHINVSIENPEIWWPSGFGEHPLYTLETELLYENNVIDSNKLRIGLRTITVTQK